MTSLHIVAPRSADESVQDGKTQEGHAQAGTHWSGPGAAQAERTRIEFAAGAAQARSPAAMEAHAVAAFNEMDRRLHGDLSRDSQHWNISGGPRVRMLVTEILEHARARQLDRVHVVNMSGLNEGKPDPVVFDMVAAQLGATGLAWSVVDHPLSDTFADPAIVGWLEDRGIVRHGHDFREPASPIPDGSADIVLCTEILEHLDYTAAIRVLRLCQSALRPGGLLVITTPNAVSVRHRIMVALGQWDFQFHMDRPEDVDRGLLGHINYYDHRRLGRLMTALGFASVRTRTFNAGHGPGEYRNFMTRAAAATLRAISRILPNSGQVLLVAAQRPG